MGFKNYSSKKKDELKYEVIDKIGVLDSDSPNPKELRAVRWNNGDVKFDLRPWKQNDDGTETPLKGLTFDGEELLSLYEILKKMSEEDDDDEDESEVE